MTANHEHTPTTQEMLKKYIYQGGTLEEFYRWLDGVCMNYQQLGFSEGVDHAAENRADEIAAAEQRGAARAWDEGHKAGWDECWIEHTSYGMKHSPAINPYRADQMEGDDD